MYFAGVLVRRIEDVTEALWGTRALQGAYPYVFLDGIWLKRSWGGEVQNVSVLVVMAVNQDGYREIVGAVEGMKEDKCAGLVEVLGDVYPDVRWQGCMVHFYRNVFSKTPKGKLAEVAAMLKAIHAREDKLAAQEKAEQVVEKLKQMKFTKAANLLQQGIDDTLGYYAFPREHQKHLRTNNPLERIMKEIRRRTRVVGSFPDGNSALMLACARLRYVMTSKWGEKRYMNMDKLNEWKLSA